MTSTQVTARELRPMLREAELAVARIERNSSSEELLALYALLDQIADALPQIQQAGAHLEPELIRFETIGSILRDKARNDADDFQPCEETYLAALDYYLMLI
mgnify:CR=1 FL=1